MTAGVYRLRPAWLGFFLLVGLGLAGGGIAIAFREPWAGLLLALFGLLCLVPVRVRLELSDDSVTVHNGYTERRLARASIVGRRIRQHQHARVLELVTDAPGERPLKVPMMLRSDSAFEAWLSGIRDLDAEEQEAVLTELAATHDPRAIAAARRISRVLTACVALCAVWVVFFPRPYHAAVAVNVLLPLIALLVLARGRGIYSLEANRNDPRPSVVLAFILPGPVLAMRLLNDGVSLLRPVQLVFPTIALAALLGVLAARSDPRRSRWWFAFPLLLTFYTGSTLAWANFALDRSAPQRYRALVTSKYVVRGKSTSYSVVLDPWGPRDSRESVGVPRRVYEQVREGQEVRVILREGSLKMPWFYVVP